ncbi:MAG: MBOAT family O-acyltransferase [Evtepia sp.]
MARSLGRMLGFEFCINFDYPYISKRRDRGSGGAGTSPLSPGSDYVYIPWAGNRCGKIRQCVNILIVWALTGFWHGAGWNFLFWGFYYGVLLLIEKLVLGRYIKRLPAVFQHLYAMVIVIIGWVFFASRISPPPWPTSRSACSPAARDHGRGQRLAALVGMFLLGVVGSTPWPRRSGTSSRAKGHALWPRASSVWPVCCCASPASSAAATTPSCISVSKGGCFL